LLDSMMRNVRFGRSPSESRWRPQSIRNLSAAGDSPWNESLLGAAFLRHALALLAHEHSRIGRADLLGEPRRTADERGRAQERRDLGSRHGHRLPRRCLPGSRELGEREPLVHTPDMPFKSWFAAVPVAAVAALVVSGCGDDGVSLRTFAGDWQAHARTLSTSRTGDGREWLSLGMSSPFPRRNFVFDIRFRLSRPQGTPHDATATATITAVRVGDQSTFTAAHPAPRVGESFRIHLLNGVLTSRLSRANYCGPGVNWPTAGCGA
jgi:hypothetical protein